MDGRKVATVWLDPERRGRVSGRLGPLPAFRAVVRLHEALKAAQAAVEEVGVGAAPEAALAEEERALAGLGALDLALVDGATGTPVPTRALQVLPGRPPRVRVEW